MQSTQAQLFDINNCQEWKRHLDEQGYVVIENILENDSYKDILNTFKNEWREMCPQFDFNDSSTWLNNCEPLHSGWYYGMVNGHGFGQSDFQWKLRTNKNILNIWENVHNTNELVVSFDGLSVFLSPDQDGIMYHVDEHPSDTLYSIQGAYNFFPVTELDSGFVVIPGSHKKFKSTAPEEYKFICVDDENPLLLNAIHLLIPENCFVLWNSKTIHSSIGMDMNKGLEFNRLTSYITYFPKSLRSEDVKQKRISGYLNSCNCSHYAIYHQPKGNPIDQRKLKLTLGENREIPFDRLSLI